MSNMGPEISMGKCSKTLNVYGIMTDKQMASNLIKYLF